MSLVTSDTLPEENDILSHLMEGCDNQTNEEVKKFLGLVDEVKKYNFLSVEDIQQIKSVIGFVYNVYDGQTRESEKMRNGGATPVFLHKIRAASFSLQGFLLLHKALKTGEKMNILQGIEDHYLKNALVVYQECARNTGIGVLRDHILYWLAHDVPEDGRGALIPPANMLDKLLKKKYNESILIHKRTKLNENHANELIENINAMQTTPFFKEFKTKYPNLMPHLNRFLNHGEIQENGTTLVTTTNLEGNNLHGTYQNIFLADALLFDEKHGKNKSYSSGRGIERVRICTDVSMALYYVYLREQGVDNVNASWIINRIAKVTTVKYGTLSLTDDQSLNDQIKSNPGMMLGKLGDILDNLRSLGDDPDIVESGYLAYKKDVRDALSKEERYPLLDDLLHDKIPLSQRNIWYKNRYVFSGSSAGEELTRKYLKKIKKYERYLASINVQGYGWIDKLIPHLYAEMGMSEFYETDDNLIKINIEILNLLDKKNAQVTKEHRRVGKLIPGFVTQPESLDTELFRYIRSKSVRELQRRTDAVNKDHKKKGVDLLPSVTLLDLYTSSGWTKEMLVEFLSSLTGVQIDNDLGQKNYTLKAGLDHINNIFAKAFDTYLYELDAYKRIPKPFQTKWLKGNVNADKKVSFRGFTSFDDIWYFLNGAEKQHATPVMKRIRCSILKLAYVEGVVAQSTPALEQNEEFFSFIVDRFIPLLRVVPDEKQTEFDTMLEAFKVKENKTVQDYQSFNEGFSMFMFRFVIPYGEEDKMFLGSENIPRIELRRKLDRGQVQKLIADPKYNMLSALQDMFGIRIHVYGQDQGLKIAHFLRKYLYTGDIRYGNKNFFTDLEKFKLVYGTDTGFEAEFLHMVQETIPQKSLGDEESDLVSKKSSARFQGTDLTGSVGLSHDMETQIVYAGNVNQTKGTSHRGIYEAKRIIREMIRLEGYVSAMYIRGVLRDKIVQYKDALYAFGGGDKEKAVAYFFEAILNESDLFAKLSIHLDGTKKTYYVLTERRQELDFWFLLPAGSVWDIQIGGERKKIDGNRYLSWRKRHKELIDTIDSQVIAITQLVNRSDKNQSACFANLMATKNALQSLLVQDFDTVNTVEFKEKHTAMIAQITSFQSVLASAA